MNLLIYRLKTKDFMVPVQRRKTPRNSVGKRCISENNNLRKLSDIAKYSFFIFRMAAYS